MRVAEEEEAAVEEEKNRSWFKSLSYSGDLRKRIQKKKKLNWRKHKTTK